MLCGRVLRPTSGGVGYRGNIFRQLRMHDRNEKIVIGGGSDALDLGGGLGETTR